RVVDAVLDDEPGAGRADLAGVQEDRGDCVVDGGVEVDVREDDVRVLATELERDPLDRGRRGGHDATPGGKAAGERDQVDVGVLGERRADLRAGAEDQVGHASGYAG